jgi:hypothetical protein
MPNLATRHSMRSIVLVTTAFTSVGCVAAGEVGGPGLANDAGVTDPKETSPSPTDAARNEAASDDTATAPADTHVGGADGADGSSDTGITKSDTGSVDTGFIDVGIDSGPKTSHDLYVATTGSDSNAGTAAAPLRTILRASQIAVADTTVHVAAGTYTGGFQTTKGGTAAGRIYYVSTARWGAKLVPPSSSSSETGWDNRGAYVTIDGFEVDGGVDPTSGAKWTVGINVAGTGDVVQNCHAHHIYNTGVGGSSGGAGILLDSWYGFNDMRALANVVDHVGPLSGGGSWYHGIYQTATGAIENNLVYANAGGGVHLWHDANHIDVTNNTSFGNGTGFIVGGGDYVHTSGPCDYVNVTNNIAFDNTTIGFDEEGGVGTHNTFAHNLSFKNGTNWRLKLTAHTADVTDDPGFVLYLRGGGGDYHLKSGSPAIDVGSATYAPAFDFDLVARPRGAGFDLGAYESH